MSQLPYLHPTDYDDEDNSTRTFEHGTPLLLNFSRTSHESSTFILRTPTYDHTRTESNSTRKMQTTVAIVEQDPHRFKVLPLRQVRNSGVSAGTVAQPTVAPDWAAALRRKRNMSAGSTPFSERARTHYSAVSNPEPCVVFPN